MNNKIVLNPPFLCIINGAQGSGKSHLLNYLMREISLSDTPFDFGILFSNTIFEKTFPYIPDKYKFENFDENVLKNLMKIQRKNVKKNIVKQAFVIFDDCLDDKDQFNNETIKKLTTQLRHYNISCFITSQYPHIIPPRIRSNSMHSFFLNIGSGRRELEAIYQCYANRFSSMAEFKEFYYKNIEDHKFIGYDKQLNKFVVYRAPENIPKFSLKYNRKIKK